MPYAVESLYSEHTSTQKTLHSTHIPGSCADTQHEAGLWSLYAKSKPSPTPGLLRSIGLPALVLATRFRLGPWGENILLALEMGLQFWKVPVHRQLLCCPLPRNTRSPLQNVLHGSMLDPSEPLLRVRLLVELRGDEAVALQSPRCHQDEDAEGGVAKAEALWKRLAVRAD